MWNSILIYCSKINQISAILVFFIFNNNYDGWIIHNNPSLPRAGYRQAVGYDASNHTIWILGGDDYDTFPRQLVSFNCIDETFTDHGETYLPFEVEGWSQHYAQVGSILYITDTVMSYFNSFDTRTMTFTENYLRPHTLYGGHRCIVNIRNEYLAQLQTNAEVQIYMTNESENITKDEDNIWLIWGIIVISLCVVISLFIIVQNQIQKRKKHKQQLIEMEAVKPILPKQKSDDNEHIYVKQTADANDVNVDVIGANERRKSEGVLSAEKQQHITTKYDEGVINDEDDVNEHRDKEKKTKPETTGLKLQ